jgi:hypothetical protein
MREYTPIRLSQESRRLDRRMISDVLRQQNITYDVESEPHVVLRPSVPWVQDRGWLNFIGGWHYGSQPPGDSASWVSAIAPTSAGKMEVWLKQVTPAAMYLVALDVMCAVGGPNPAFKVGASDATGELVTAQPPEQTLLVVTTPSMDLTLVTLEPNDLSIWTFLSAEVSKLAP